MHDTNQMKWNRSTLFQVFMIIGLALILLPVFTLILASPALIDSWDFSDLGTVGTTVNGLTSPFIGVGGAILVYISFREQVRANKVQFDAIIGQRELDLNLRLYDELHDYLSKLAAIKDEKGRDASYLLKTYCRKKMYGEEISPFYASFDPIIMEMNSHMTLIIGRLVKNSLLSEDARYLIGEKIKTIYLSRFSSAYTFVAARSIDDALKVDQGHFWATIKHLDDLMRELTFNLSQMQAKYR